MAHRGTVSTAKANSYSKNNISNGDQFKYLTVLTSSQQRQFPFHIFLKKRKRRNNTAAVRVHKHQDKNVYSKSKLSSDCNIRASSSDQLICTLISFLLWIITYWHNWHVYQLVLSALSRLHLSGEKVGHRQARTFDWLMISCILNCVKTHVKGVSVLFDKFEIKYSPKQ